MLRSILVFALTIPTSFAAWPPCFNVNSKEEPAGSGTCVPSFDDPQRILVTFKPQIHDVPMNSQVIDRSHENINPSTGRVVDLIAAAPTPYQRKIYACVPPLTVNTSSLKCEFKRENHACSAGGSVTGTFPSEVSRMVSGANRSEQFQNAVNKKLACCLNEFGSSASTDTVIKFDCVENLKNGYADFDILWASADDEADGGQPNAMVLANGLGKPLTGFYALNGARCNEFSEFAGPIQPGKIKGDIFTSVGQPIPESSSSGFAFLKQKYLSKGLTIPRKVADQKRCPILVRAAVVVKCPSNPMLPAAQKTYELTPTGVATQRRCTVASALQVNIRLEQVYEIDTMPKMKTEDTITDSKNAATISIDRVIAGKYGNACPPGTSRQGDVCVY